MPGQTHPWAALLLCIGTLGASSCAATAEHSANMFGRMMGKKTVEEQLGIKTPDDRIKELQKLAKGAKKKSTEEQQRIVADLSNEYQKENDSLVRRQILRTLGMYPQPTAVVTIVAALKDSDTETRRVACKSLGVHGGPEAVQELARVVSSDTNVDVRIAAVRAMGQTNDKAALAPLAEVIGDADPAIQSRARESMAAISGRDYGNNLDAWREFAKTGKTDAPEISIAERVTRALY